MKRINNYPLPKMKHELDILDCLANISNDEVFTPPHIARKMIDLLPAELWSNPNAKFLDPFTKSGVFLREIARRLIDGLEDQIPDLQDRIDHIFGKQLYGIAVTELTALVSRRSLYCTKKANHPKYAQATIFDDEQGNIFFEDLPHTFERGRCIYCGINDKELNEDSREGKNKFAYPFIHNKNPYENMKFDVIIGNPPYQLQVGNDGGNSSKAKAIYHQFIEQAMKLESHYLIMITPSRWMTRTTEGIPNEWVDKMLSSKQFREIHDFLDATGIFTGTPPKGGVNYFLWDKDYDGECDYYLYKNGDDKEPFYEKRYLASEGIDIVIRDVMALQILSKIIKVEKDYITREDANFSDLVSPKDFFTNKQFLTSSWNGFTNTPNKDYNIKYYPNKNLLKGENDFGWININQIPKNRPTKDLHKVYIPAGGGSGTDKIVLGKPFYGEPNSVCSQTYLVIGYNPAKHQFTKEECFNIISYIKTRFFRYLVSIKKKTQNGARGVYQFVPVQDFTQPWTDEELYKKYNLSQEEIDYIENLIDVME